MFGSRTDGLSRPLVTRQFARAGAVVVAAFLVASLFTGMPARPVLAAPAGNGLQFDGTNDYVTFGSSASLGVTNFTVELWFKRTGTGVGMPTSGGTGGLASAVPLFTKGAPEADDTCNLNMTWFLGIDTATNRLAADFETGSGGANHALIGGTAVSSNVWHHAAVTLDGSNLKIYLDGVLDGTLATTNLPCLNGIQHAALGTVLNSSGTPGGNQTPGWFQGVLDEARVWNTARSLAQIQAAKNSELTSGTGLVARWGLNEVSGTVAADSVGSLTGTLTNGPTWVPGFDPPANAAPVCSNVVLSTPQNTTGETNPSCTDANGDPLTYSIVAQPAHGTASVVAGKLRFVPTTGYAGSDTFTYKANDSQADSNTASVAVTVTAPGANYGLQFDGTNDYVTFGSSAGLGVTNFTVELWFKRTGAGIGMATSGGSGGLTSAVPLMAKGAPQGDDVCTENISWFLGIDTATNRLAADFETGSGGANHGFIGGTAVSNNVWHHAALTLDGTNLKLYLDGVLDGTLATTALPCAAAIGHAALGTALGSTGTPGGTVTPGYFAGVLDEARVWNVARSLSQIQDTKDDEITSGTGLVARWGMNEGSGTAAASSVGSFTGTLTNGPVWVPGFVPSVVNHAPTIVLSAPADDATGVSLSPTLDAIPSDIDGDTLDVAFYGRTAGGGSGSVAIVQAIGAVDNGTAGQTNTVLSVSKTVTAGNLIVVGFGYWAAHGTENVTDNLGNTYTRVEYGDNGGIANGSLWYAPVTSGGALTTITAAHPASSYNVIQALEISAGTFSAAGGGNTGNGPTATWANSKTIPANGLALGFTVTSNPVGHSAGAASGSPSTAITLQQYHAGGGNLSSSFVYAAAGGTAVTGFTGTTVFTADAFIAAGAIFAPSNPWSLIGTVTGVASGNHATKAWPGRAASTEYEWYAEADDGALSAPSTVRSFTTGGAVSNDFSIGATPGSRTVAQGSSATYTVNTALLSGSAETIVLSVLSGLPAGASASFDPATVSAGGSSTLTVSTADTTPPGGPLTLTIRGVAPSATHTTTVSLTVTGLGFLRVTSSPAVPAQISINGVIADSWGLNWVKVPAGNYTVSFSHVEGYSEPADQAVAVTAGNTTTVTGTFVQRGSLRVITSPAVAGRISVDGTARNNWGLWSDLAAGAHQVCFGPVAGFNPPACQNTTVVAGSLTTVTGVYTVNAAAPGATNVGFLRVTSSPAVPTQISLNGVVADSWGLNWVELAPGQYTVHFSHVEGYSEPVDQQVTVTAGATTTLSGTFTQRGSLRVITSPAVAGTVSVDTVRRNDWGMWTDLPTGAHQVCFGAVGAFSTPACQNVTLNAGALTTATGTYTP